MTDRTINLDTGEIQNTEPAQAYGRGLPDGWRWLDSVEPNELMAALPQIVRDFDRRLERLELDA